MDAILNDKKTKFDEGIVSMFLNNITFALSLVDVYSKSMRNVEWTWKGSLALSKINRQLPPSSVCLFFATLTNSAEIFGHAISKRDSRAKSGCCVRLYNYSDIGVLLN